MKRFFCLFAFILALSGASRAQYYLEDRWPNLSFFLPVGFHASPDSTRRIFVIEQNGRIKVFTDTGNVTGADTSTFLNIRSKLPNISPGNEYGLLGMAFHPNYNQNGYVFINYCQFSPLRTVISRFTRDPANPNRVLPNSEKIILIVTQPFANHNAGSLLFGNDGYLYITMGDGGSGGDPGNRAQNRTNMLGKILRIDVNVPENGPAYAIPPDNPFASNSMGWVKEMYALGVRNPWQMTKDAETGTIWFGDVGQGAREEIDTLRKGANYGWKITEGNLAYTACGTCDTSNYEKPLVDYGRTLGISVTGGYVYRGQEMPRMRGAYFYGDYSSRRIWTLKKNQPAGPYVNADFLTAGGSISVFGEDYNRELYVARYFASTGKFYRIRCAPPAPSLTAPAIRTVCAGDSISMIAPSLPGIGGYRWSTGDTSLRVVLKSPGVYNLSLQVRNSEGCWSSSSAPVRFQVKDVLAPPAISTLSGCEGDTLEATLPAGLVYTWSASGSQNRFSTSSPGAFWVFAADSSNCKSDTAFFQANFAPVPSAPVLSLAGDTLKTSVAPGVWYEWLKDGEVVDTTMLPFFVPSLPGLYTLVIISAQGCRSPESSGLNVLSVKPAGKKSLPYVVCPNPVKSNLELRFHMSGLTGSVSAEVFNTNGQVVITEVKHFKPGETTWILETDKLRPGTYSLSIKSGKKNFESRFVKE
jgi:glucose/arabinose dehydrogenase